MVRLRQAHLEAFQAHVAGGGAPDSFTFDIGSEERSLAARAQREPESLVRHVAYVAALSLSPLSRQAPDTTIAAHALAEISPISPVWSIAPISLVIATRNSHDARHESYRWNLIENHPDTSARLEVLLGWLQVSSMRSDTGAARRYYQHLISQYPRTQAAKIARADYDPDKKIVTGRQVPSFSIASIGHSKAEITTDDMKGKLYLIDFWATWCGPCIAEMDNLHKVYEKYRSQDFEILSISLDSTTNFVDDFRARRWKMPWLHGFLPDDFRNPIARSFEVLAIPRPILVGADGKIVAVGDALRGESLSRTIGKAVAAQKISR
jgi:thiol-disulfide isomerase/thioredoxin